MRARSVRHVTEEVLRRELATIHAQCHTIYGLLSWDQPRRGLADRGLLAHAITDELLRRGLKAPDCSFCRGPPQRE